MENNDIIQQLYSAAAEYRLADFYKIFTDMENGGGLLPEAYLLRGQLKLMASDETALLDFRRADSCAKPVFPCLYGNWQPQDPNTFVVFSTSPGSISRFLETMPEIGERMRRAYGEAGYEPVCQLKSEILYFTGRTDEAIPYARDQYEFMEADCAHVITTAYVLLRCYMAEGRIGEAQDILLDIIDIARKNESHPTCSRVYSTVRSWVNLTTGWSGDMPRYHRTPDNVVLPVLEDRAAAIYKGIDELGPTEEPFVQFAQKHYGATYTMRALYMDIFRAVNWFRSGDRDQAQQNFMKAHLIAHANGLVMPFVEYGMQIVPMLEYMARSEPDCDSEWLDSVITRAEKYEESLKAFRGQEAE